jgi:hypothetical protein
MKRMCLISECEVRYSATSGRQIMFSEIRLNKTGNKYLHEVGIMPTSTQSGAGHLYGILSAPSRLFTAFNNNPVASIDGLYERSHYVVELWLARIGRRLQGNSMKPGLPQYPRARI